MRHVPLPSLILFKFFHDSAHEFLSVIVYWVEPCDVADRGAITTTLFLAAVTFKTYMSTLLPALPYLTSVERFLMAGTVLLLCQGVMIAWVGTWCVNDENTPGFPGTPYSLKFKKHEPNVDDAENWRKSPDGTTAAYWRDDDADYWRSSDEARERLSVLADQGAYYMTIISWLLTVLALCNRIIRLNYKLYRIHHKKAVAEAGAGISARRGETPSSLTAPAAAAVTTTRSAFTIFRQIRKNYVNNALPRSTLSRPLSNSDETRPLKSQMSDQVPRPVFLSLRQSLFINSLGRSTLPSAPRRWRSSDGSLFAAAAESQPAGRRLPDPRGPERDLASAH